MKKIVLLTSAIVFSLSVSTAFAINPDSEFESKKHAVSDKKENTLSEEEISCLTNRAEEIRDMDKTNLTGTEKRMLKKEIKKIKQNVQKDDVVVMTGSTLFFLILILLCL